MDQSFRDLVLFVELKKTQLYYQAMGDEEQGAILVTMKSKLNSNMYPTPLITYISSFTSVS